MALDKDTCALLVIDAIDSLPDVKDSVYDNEPTPEMAAFSNSLAKVVDLAHQAGVPVVYANDAHIPGIDHELELWAPHGIAGRTRIFPEVDVADSDLVITKRRYSGFFETDLDLTLRELGVTTLVVVGCDTNICVAHTLADAFYRNYQTIVVEPATITFLGVGTQEGAIDTFRKCYGSTIVDVDALAAMLA